MSRKQGPMFFKPMVPGFSEKLSIPHAFLKHLEGERCDEAVLKSQLEKSWHVKVCRGKEGMWFDEGWFDFVLDHDLRLGEFLVFRYDGDMVFYVKIYDTSSCEKVLPLVYKEKKNHGKQRCMEDENHVKENKDHGKQRGGVHLHSGAERVERESSYKSKFPHFAATIVPTNVRRSSHLNIRSAFIKANGVSKIDQMTLKDPKGRSWPVKVHRKGLFRFWMCPILCDQRPTSRTRVHLRTH